MLQGEEIFASIFLSSLRSRFTDGENIKLKSFRRKRIEHRRGMNRETGGRGENPHKPPGEGKTSEITSQQEFNRNLFYSCLGFVSIAKFKGGEKARKIHF
jgi:hypothetical protein